jgi:hypothetical protein
MLLDNYPGLTQGLARVRRIEDILRSSAMMPLLEHINGLEVRQFTPRMMELLVIARSPFLYPRKNREACGVLARAEDACLFLWIVSPSNSLKVGSQPPPEFYDSLRPSEPDYFRKFYRAIDSYYERAVLDQPSSVSGGRPVPTSLSAALVHRLASAYGWPAEVFDAEGCPIQVGQPGTAGIKDTPFAALYQYSLWIRVEADPRIPLTSKLRKRKQVRIVNFWRARAKAFGVTVEEAVTAWQEGREPVPPPPAPPTLLEKVKTFFTGGEHAE